MITANQYRVNDSKVVHDAVEGEVIIINLETGAYYSLKGTGADIWELTKNGLPIPAIVQEITQKYHQRSHNIEEAVNRLMGELQQEELIVPVAEKNGEALEVTAGIPESDPAREKTRFEEPVLHKYTDMREMLLLDPIHEVDDSGWPAQKTDRA
jgi:hypothetical protein